MSAVATPVRFEPNTRVRDIIPVFYRFPSPRILAGFLVAALIARLVVGDWSWADLITVVVIVALQPFTEWTIHTFVLHFRPRQVGGHTVDLHLAKEHRRHHRDPKKIEAVFIPVRALLVGIPVGVVLTLLVCPSKSVALTILLTYAVILTIYEWTHFYVHSGCKPKNRYAAYIERAHRLHHYRNENYWMGVTVHAADHVLGTFPDKDSVPVSPTAKTLGID